VSYRGGIEDIQNDTWKAAEKLKYERRVKQNRNSNVYPYVFTKLEDGKRSLTFINPSNGDERFSIVLAEKVLHTLLMIMMGFYFF